MEHFFFLRIQVKTQKKGLHQKWNTFFPKFKWRPAVRWTPESNYWGNADVDHTQIIGVDTVRLSGGIYSPHSLRVSAPLIATKIGLVGMKGYLKTYNRVKYILSYLSRFWMRLLLMPNFADGLRVFKPKSRDLLPPNLAQTYNSLISNCCPQFHIAEPNRSQVLSKSLKLRAY